MLPQCDFLGHWSFKISTIRAGFQAQGGLEMTFKASKTVKGMDAMPALQQRVPNMKLHTFEFFESISDFLLPCHVMLVATMAHRNVSASHTSFIIPLYNRSLQRFDFDFASTHFWGASWWASKCTAMPTNKMCLLNMNRLIIADRLAFICQCFPYLSTWSSSNVKFSFTCQSHSVKKCVVEILDV